MDESHVVDFWILFKEYLDKKNVEIAAERFVDLLADYGVSDETLQESLGSCPILDQAITYYLDIDDYEVYDDEEEWDD